MSQTHSWRGPPRSLSSGSRSQTCRRAGQTGLLGAVLCADTEPQPILQRRDLRLNIEGSLWPQVWAAVLSHYG